MIVIWNDSGLWQNNDSFGRTDLFWIMWRYHMWTKKLYNGQLISHSAACDKSINFVSNLKPGHSRKSQFSRHLSPLFNNWLSLEEDFQTFSLRWGIISGKNEGLCLIDNMHFALQISQCLYVVLCLNFRFFPLPFLSQQIFGPSLGLTDHFLIRN